MEYLKLSIIFVVVAILSGAGSAQEKLSNLDNASSKQISGGDYLAIEAALRGIKDRKIDVIKYNIFVSEVDDNIYVAFEDKVIKSEYLNEGGMRGGRGGRPTIIVVLNASDMAFIRWFHVR